jgi:hypothetical protein
MQTRWSCFLIIAVIAFGLAMTPLILLMRREGRVLNGASPSVSFDSKPEKPEQRLQVERMMQQAIKELANRKRWLRFPQNFVPFTMSRHPSDELGSVGPLPLTVAVVTDMFSFTQLKHTFERVFQLHPLVWKMQLAEARPDLLLVESAWHGLEGEWSSHGGQFLGLLPGLLAWFRERKLPCIFWNKVRFFPLLCFALSCTSV